MIAGHSSSTSSFALEIRQENLHPPVDEVGTPQKLADQNAGARPAEKLKQKSKMGIQRTGTMGVMVMTEMMTMVIMIMMIFMNMKLIMITITQIIMTNLPANTRGAPLLGRAVGASLPNEMPPTLCKTGLSLALGPVMIGTD